MDDSAKKKPRKTVVSHLKSLREEAKNPARAEDARGISEKISEEPDDVWTFISDVRENYQLPLA